MTAAELEQTFHKRIEEMGTKFMQFPWENREAYAEWMAQTYFFVRHSTTLICLAAVEFGANHREEHYHHLAHLKEELGHDLLLVRDLENMGRPVANFQELPETALFYQNQFHLVKKNPASLMGYALLLEGVAAKYCGQLYEKIVKLYGPKCTTFVNVHSHVDVDHFAAGSAEIKNVKPEDVPYVLQNLEQSYLLYTMMLDKVIRRHASPQATRGSQAKSA